MSYAHSYRTVGKITYAKYLVLGMLGFSTWLNVLLHTKIVYYRDFDYAKVRHLPITHLLVLIVQVDHPVIIILFRETLCT